MKLTAHNTETHEVRTYQIRRHTATVTSSRGDRRVTAANLAREELYRLEHPWIKR